MGAVVPATVDQGADPWMQNPGAQVRPSSHLPAGTASPNQVLRKRAPPHRRGTGLGAMPTFQACRQNPTYRTVHLELVDRPGALWLRLQPEVLFMDVMRPLRPPVSWLNKAVIKAVALSPYVGDAKRRHLDWERRFEELRPRT